MPIWFHIELQYYNLNKKKLDLGNYYYFFFEYELPAYIATI